MGEPNKAFCHWAAAQLLSQFRQGNQPAYAKNTDFIWEPFLTCLREQIQQSDKDIILRLLKNENSKMWAALLTRGILDDEELTDELVKQFDLEDDQDRQLGLLYQGIKLARKIDENTEIRMIDWIESNLDFFLADQKEFFSPKDKVIDKLKNRMEGSQFKNKRWQYLYSAHAAEDTNAIRAFIEPYLNDADPLVARTAKKSLALLK